MIETLGKRLQFYVEPEDNHIDQILEPVIHIAKTRGKVRVDSINGDPTRGSPYRAALARVLQQRSDHRHIWFEC